MCETVTYLNSKATPIILLYQPHVGIHRIRKLQGLYFFERLLYPCLLIPRFTFYLVFVYSVPLFIFEVSFLLESYLRLLLFQEILPVLHLLNESGLQQSWDERFGVECPPSLGVFEELRY